MVKIFLSVFLCLNFSIILPQSIKKNFEEAQRLDKIGEYQNALTLVNYTMLKKKKVPPNYHYLKYSLHLKLGDLSQAKEALNKGIVEYPNSIDLLNSRANFNIMLNNFTPAITDINKILTICKSRDSIAFKIKLSAMKFKIRDFKGALNNIKDILRFDSENFEANNILGAIYIEIKEYDKALEIFKKIKDHHPDGVLVNIGYIYQLMGKQKLAVHYFNQALSSNDKNPLALSNRAKSFLIMGQLKSALADINKSINLMPNNSYAYKTRGEIWLKKRDKNLACNDFIIAINFGYITQYGNDIIPLVKNNCGLEAAGLENMDN